jgi:hypothetical protein
MEEVIAVFAIIGQFSGLVTKAFLTRMGTNLPNSTNKSISNPTARTVKLDEISIRAIHFFVFTIALWIRVNASMIVRYFVGADLCVRPL